MPGHGPREESTSFARLSRACASLVLAACVIVALPGPAAHAYAFKRTLSRGDRGGDVRALEIRVVGWFPRRVKRRLIVNRVFGYRTVRAVKAFQRHYGLTADGIAGPQTFRALNRLEDRNGSTDHFNYSEFTQNRNRACSARANAYAGTFRGGMTSPRRTRKNVRRLMWRLEALRAKARNNPVGINSGFRSIPYNRCIGGAQASQHLYGTAADNRVARVDNHTARVVARGSQVHGIACYSSTSHNHFDIRIENRDARSTQYWWWPRRDRYGRDLTSNRRLCWGERRRTSSARTSAATLRMVTGAVMGAGSLVPSLEEIEAFERAGEPPDLRGAD